MQGGRQGYRCRVGTAASQGRIIVILIHTLEAGDDHDAPVLQLMHDAVCVDALQTGVSMHPVVCIAIWNAFSDTAGMSMVSKAMAISATEPARLW